MSFGYSIYDFFHDSHAEKKRDEYKKIYDKLVKKIEEIEESLPEVSQAIEELHHYYTINPDSAKGLIKTTYEAKEELFYNGCMELYEALQKALSSLREKKNDAWDEYEYWKEECRKEDEEEKSRSYQ